ncbi:MAG: 8-amino-7-oxononanoate synthase, partial [Sulfuritalea sp.]|nr:8-amino-7-oxononanoate synthase [Sulfuritalea sp.]
MNPALDQLLQQELVALEAGARRRRLRPLQMVDGRLQDAQGRVLIDAASNDYLGLAQHPLVKARAAEWAARHGAGAPS